MHTCQLFENFMGETAQKCKILPDFFLAELRMFDSCDHSHGG